MKYFTLIAVGAIAVLLLSLTPAALAKGGDAVIKTGVGSLGSEWKLKGKLDDGRIEVEFEVDQNRVGKRWLVKLLHNGKVVFRDIRTTRAPSGSFTVHRLIAPAAGPDRIVAKARALRSGERIRGAIKL
jgi:hypothetical protein